MSLLAKENHGCDCVILGNGPSLKEVLDKDLDKLKKNKMVAVNMFCSSNEFRLLKPEYYVIADPLYFNNEENERIVMQRKSLVENLNKIDWNMTLFLPSINRKSNTIQKISNKNINIVFYNLTPLSGFDKIQYWLFTNNLGMPAAKNVLCASIFIMANLNFKNIYLLGADHSWINGVKVNDKNELVRIDEHFYDTSEYVFPYSIYVFMKGFTECMQTHERLAKYTKHLDVNVWNATKGSYIDAYPRKYDVF